MSSIGAGQKAPSFMRDRKERKIEGGGCGLLLAVYKGPNTERSDLRFEAWKPVFVKRDTGLFFLQRS